MFSSSYPSEWRVDLNSGRELISCLYVRDSYGLTPAMSPLIPPLAPKVMKQTIDSADRPMIELQWSLWWSESLAVEYATPKGDELRSAFGRLSNEIRAWSSARYMDFIHIAHENNLNVRDLVQAMSQRGPLSLKIFCLPLSEKRAWQLSATAAIISYSFYADWAGYVDWLWHLPEQ